MYWNEFQIKELAKMFSLKPETIRYYEGSGILSSHRNEENNYRTFDIDDISNLGTIMMLRSMNLSIKDIQAFYTQQNFSQLIEDLHCKRQHTEQQLLRIQRTQREIDGFYRYLVEIYDQLNQITIQRTPQWRCSHTMEKLDIPTMTKAYTDLMLKTEYLPYYYFKMSKESFLHGPQRYTQYGLVYEAHRRFHPESTSFSFGSEQCLRYVFWGNKKKTLQRAYQEIRDWLALHRFEIAGDIVERYILGTPTSSLMEFWVPVR